MKTIKFNKRWIFILLLLAAILITAFYPSPQYKPIGFIDRNSGELKTEKVPGEKWLVWLYNNPVGEASLRTIVKRKFVSSIYGEMMDNPSSAEKIDSFVEDFGIDLTIAKTKQFNSFNDFFTRKLKLAARPIDTNSNILISPADGKILAWTNIANADFIVKGYRFNVHSFLNQPEISKNYVNGSLLIIRLAPNDYHRFHFPLSGTVSKSTTIDGDYYSVNPIALHKKTEIFCLNKREYVAISNPVFGDVIMVEVGATMVGSIIQTYTDSEAIKGCEKGFFEFGGSTIILLFEQNKILIDKDLLSNTTHGLETSVKMGERIGISNFSVN